MSSQAKEQESRSPGSLSFAFFKRSTDAVEATDEGCGGNEENYMCDSSVQV